MNSCTTHTHTLTNAHTRARQTPKNQIKMERSKSLDLPRKLVAFDHEPARKSMHLTRVPDSRKSLHLHDSRKSIQLHRVQPTREESVDFTKKAIKFADAQCLPLGLVFAVLAGLTLSHLQSLSLSIFPSRHHSGVCVCVSVCLSVVCLVYLPPFFLARALPARTRMSCSSFLK